MAKVRTESIAAGVPLAEPGEAPVSAPPPVPAEAASAAAGVAAAGALTPENANRPGLETPAVASTPTNPFKLLNKWEQGEGQSKQVFSLRALEVPGGCLVKSAFAFPGYMGESLCFVPNVSVHDGKLVDASIINLAQA